MTADWNPETYAAFAGLRLRPALDLLAQVHGLPGGDVIDLGCGNGAVGPALAARFPWRRLIGVDTSPAMLAKAEETGVYDQLIEADAAIWTSQTPPALIFSNALIHWLPGHEALFARLCRLIAPGGMLAVQMPRQYGAPSHALLREIAQEMFPDRFDFSGWLPPVAPPEEYQRMLAPLGRVSVWETRYMQVLAPEVDMHPVRAFTRSTAMRPFVEKLSAEEVAGFAAHYDAALEAAYPCEADGSVLFAFRRVFFTLMPEG